MCVKTKIDCQDRLGTTVSNIEQRDCSLSVSSPTGPYRCVQEDVIPFSKRFMGNPQIFRELTGEKRLLLAVIGQSNAVRKCCSRG
jgi:hypothetical protein